MKNKRKISSAQALDKLMTLCSRQEKCSSDLRKKLYDWEIDPAGADEIITYLKKEKFLDDERFARSYVRDKFQFNKWGKLKIGYQLKMKRLDADLIDEALLEITDESYRDMVQIELRQKLKKTKALNNWDMKSKILRFAQSRGYEFELCMSLIDSELTEE